MKYLALLILFVSISIPGSAYAATLSRPGNSLGMSLYWTFDEGTGTRVIDRSGNKNDGVLTNTPTWVNGKYGKALQFNGTTQYVSKSAPVNNLPTSAITVSAWVKINSHANWYDLVRNNWGTVDAAAPWNLFSDSAGRINFGIWPQSGPDQGMFYAQGCSSTFTTSTWHHIAGTYDGNTLVAVYLDGVLCATTNSGQAHALYTGGPIAVGEAADGTTHQVDDVRIYRRAFSATEIAALYRQGKSGIKTVARGGLVGEWKFDEGTSTVAHNSSKYTTRATLVNGASWATGKHGKALSLDGITQYAAVPDTNALNNSSLTASFWFTLAADPECDANNNWRSLIRKGATSNSSTGWDVVLEQDKSLQFDVGLGGTPSRSGGINVGMRVGVPIYLTFTYDAATGDQKIWANGTVISTKANTPTSISTNTSLLYLGGGTSGVSCPNGSGYTPGTYDDVRIYNRALSADEIYALYKERTVAVNSSQNGKLTNGLVGLWSFDGADMQGTTAYDRSGSGNNGTLSNNPVRVIGKLGQALSFNGTNNSVSIGNPSILNFGANQDFSMGMWMKTTASPGSTKPFAKSNVDTFGVGWGMYQTSGTVYLKIGDGSSVKYEQGVGPMNDGKWHHIFFTISRAGNCARYLDGVLRGTTDCSSWAATDLTNAINLNFGVNGVANGYWNGSLDDVRMYSRSLSASEVKQLYLMGK